MPPPYCVICGKRPKPVSMFSVPCDPGRLAKWQAALPRSDVILKPGNHHLCQVHFEEEDIKRKMVWRNSEGIVISEVPYQRTRLSGSAVPKFWPGDRVCRKWEHNKEKNNGGQVKLKRKHSKSHSQHKSMKVQNPKDTSATSESLRQEMVSKILQSDASVKSSYGRVYVKRPKNHTSTPASMAQDIGYEAEDVKDENDTATCPSPDHACVAQIKCEVEFIEDTSDAAAWLLLDHTSAEQEIKCKIQDVEEVNDD